MFYLCVVHGDFSTEVKKDLSDKDIVIKTLRIFSISLCFSTGTTKFSLAKFLKYI